jgi:ABC-2 type transport system permease protein
MEVKEKTVNRKSFKRRTMLELIMVIAIIILLNYISSFYFKRLDLTVEKRFTLAPSTITMLKKLDDVVYVKVYLTGDLPVGFKRLENSVRETLDEFRIYAKDNIQYEFINPSENPDKKQREDVYRELYKNGITPTNLQEKDDEGSTSQKVIFPGALISYRGNEIPVDFLKTNMNQSPEQNLNGSIEEIEYSLITSLRKLRREFGQRVAFIDGHGEIPADYVADITNSLQEYYSVERTEINGKLNSLSERVEDSSSFKVRVKYDLIIIAKPDSAFKEQDKYIIDQYLMYGGKILWLIDPVSVDSFGLRSSTVALIKDLNIENDQLFKYGVRVNPDLIQDVQCAVIPVNTAISGTQPQFTPAPWIYFPLLQPVATHPIGRNVNLVFGQFVSSVDVVGDDQKIKKTVLLTTSQNSRLMNAPVRIGLELINEKIDPKYFEKANIPVAILLEGKFRSIYNNRLTPEMYDSREIAFKDESYSTKMVVIGDGDMIRNNVKKIGYNKQPLPLGYDRFTGETFGNKEFLLNVINYMLDDSGFMNLRTREIKLRLLDRAALEDSRTYWQVINTLVPVLIIIFIGLLILFYRKRKYTKTSA